MNIRHSLPGTLFLLMLCVSCDSGDIVEQGYSVTESGRAVRMRMVVSGADQLDKDLSVALAAYADDKQYASVQRTIPASTPDGTAMDLILGNLDDHIQSAALVLAGRLRDRILTLADVDLSACADGDTLTLDLDTLQLDLYGCIQYGIFDKACIQCHATSHQAARLNLEAGHSLPNLVGVYSTVHPQMLRVKAGHPQESLLHQVIGEDGSTAVGFNHTDLVSSQFKSNLLEVRQLLDRWITNLKR